MLKSNIGPGGSDGKRIYLQYRRPGFNPRVGKIHWRREWQPTLVLLFSNTELTCNHLKYWLFIHHYLVYLKIRKWLVFLLAPHSPLPNHYNLPLKKKKILLLWSSCLFVISYSSIFHWHSPIVWSPNYSGTLAPGRAYLLHIKSVVILEDFSRVFWGRTLEKLKILEACSVVSSSLWLHRV